MPIGNGVGSDRGGLPGTGMAVPGIPVAASAREIPYDFVATFTLRGVAGAQVQDVINISVDGSFVATSIGYSFLPALHPSRDRSDTLPPVNEGRRLARLRHEEIAKRKDPKGDASRGDDVPDDASLRSAQVRASSTSLRELLEMSFHLGDKEYAPFAMESMLHGLWRRSTGIDFLYGIIDSGTGRELQNQLIHNIAGLGSADGQRPFRSLAKPMLFLPRSSIRIEIVEQSQGPLYVGGRLYFVLHGYKLLASGAGGE